ncbi:hypothetical protein [Clostridium formicaceticum]|uniref:Uncharacterized protein n=1 Tax=Clostridium formicaceticum TaxID=1497 RepID=A0AAC9WFX1_9CLOT|nr:hypothetical protein [Clostridium formicaceticum]AOY76892.1 hypothetical protein BJL90_14140 [Clostridium formicaceticum]ARE87372.1 hypothetical protein CLFO_17720 [Clostridium formicaceticum]
MEWAEKLKEEYSKIAKENSLSNLNNQKSDVQDFVPRGKTDDAVANEVGFGNRETYRQAKFIAENADEEMIKQLEGNCR